MYFEVPIVLDVCSYNRPRCEVGNSSLELGAQFRAQKNMHPLLVTAPLHSHHVLSRIPGIPHHPKLNLSYIPPLSSLVYPSSGPRKRLPGMRLLFLEASSDAQMLERSLGARRFFLPLNLALVTSSAHNYWRSYQHCLLLSEVPVVFVWSPPCTIMCGSTESPDMD